MKIKFRYTAARYKNKKKATAAKRHWTDRKSLLYEHQPGLKYITRFLYEFIFHPEDLAHDRILKRFKESKPQMCGQLMRLFSSAAMFLLPDPNTRSISISGFFFPCCYTDAFGCPAAVRSAKQKTTAPCYHGVRLLTCSSFTIGWRDLLPPEPQPVTTNYVPILSFVCRDIQWSCLKNVPLLFFNGVFGVIRCLLGRNFV